MVEIINAELAERLKHPMNVEYIRYFPDDPFFHYNEKTQKGEGVFRRGQCSNARHLCTLVMKFASRMGQVLGFD